MKIVITIKTNKSMGLNIFLEVLFDTLNQLIVAR